METKSIPEIAKALEGLYSQNSRFPSISSQESFKDLSRELMVAIKSTLLKQDPDELMSVFALGGLIQAQEAIGEKTSPKKWDVICWRTVVEVVNIHDAWLPLYKHRLLNPKTLEGKFVRRILRKPGISGGELRRSSKVKIMEYVAAITTLEKSALILGVQTGKKRKSWFLSDHGKKLMEKYPYELE